MAKIKEAIIANAATHNVLASGTRITGDIGAEEDFRIDGIIVGNVTSKGKIVIGSDSRIEGNIECSNMEIFGEIKGNVTCTENIILRASSTLTGDIKTKSIEIEPGATFTGKCSMNEIQ